MWTKRYLEIKSGTMVPFGEKVKDFIKQGPMTKKEADTVSALYQGRGREAIVVESLELDGSYYVYFSPDDRRQHENKQPDYGRK